MDETNQTQIVEYQTKFEPKIFQIPSELFPGFWGFVYFILADNLKILVDTGSGFGNSTKQIENGLIQIGEKIGKNINFESLTHVLLTHGHIDHFGGLTKIRSRTKGLIGIHELDRRIITNYEERLAVVSHRLKAFFIEAGVKENELNRLVDLYQVNKQLFYSIKIDFTFENIGMHLGPLEFIHVPGHSAGHVVIRVHNILLSGDHILNRVTPHMAPESLSSNTGLGHYLDSLCKVEGWANEIDLTLGGHETPIRNLELRVNEIKKHHNARLDKILESLDEPKTIAEISHKLFDSPDGYNAILALEETGAHVEYLYQRGIIGIENIYEIENTKIPFPFRYLKL